MPDASSEKPPFNASSRYSNIRKPKIKNVLSPDVNLNLNVRGLPQSATLTINELSNQLIANGQKVYKLGLGQSPFPVPETVVAALQREAYRKDYLPVRGLPALRAAVADFHRRSEGIAYTAEDVLIGPGSKELMFIVQLVYYGDLVIPTPSWVSYAPQAQIVGRPIRWVNTHMANGLNLMPDELEKLCHSDPKRPRIIILNYPNNPSGSTYKIDELKAIARVARKYRLIVISDEIYGELHHKGQHVSIARYYPEGTIISSGLSKWCGAGGWRLGSFVFPPSLRWLQDGMAVVASETFTATSAPIQYAAIHAFNGGLDIEQYLVRSRRILGALGRYLTRRLQTAAVSVPEPKGGFYLFADFGVYRDNLNRRGILTSVDLCEKLLADTGIAILPGSVFGRSAEELSVRLAYVDFNGENALAGVARLPANKALDSEFLNTYCSNLTRAIDLLIEWLHVVS